MTEKYDDKELFKEERLAIHELLKKNPNYFGTAPETDQKAVLDIQGNTRYEELTCVGLWPEKDLLEATLIVKLPFGFMGDLCSAGSYEYVRFFIDWDADGLFTGPGEDLGMARVNVHDIPQVGEHPLCYAVRRRFLPRPAPCTDPYVVRLRAILSWEIEPTAGDPDFVPIWGNVLECWVQIDPEEGKVVGIVPEEEAGEEQEQKELEKERIHFLEMLKENPNFFGTLPDSELKPVMPMKYNTSYEELKCIGLYPERDFLEAVLQVKLPYGFNGDLCSPGSHEFVRFFIDWNGDGDFEDLNEDAGVASVNVHDIPQAQEVRLCYALGRHFLALRAKCEEPYIVKLRAILSWQQPPTGPNFIPVWGNVLECWVQIHPIEREPEEALVAVITDPADAFPPACVGVGPTPACDLAGVTISGWAFGIGFASYRIEYRAAGAWSYTQDGVVYPDCRPASDTPDHATPRFGEPLAFLVDLEPDEYQVRLRVDGTGGPVFAQTTFSLHRAPVVIDEIGAVATYVEGPHPDDATELLKLVKSGGDPTDPETSVGGRISVVGSADFYGCGQEMIEYILQVQAAPFGSNPPQQDDPGPWTDIKPALPYGDADHPRWYFCWPNYLPNFVLNGKLSRVWANRQCLLLPFPKTLHPVRRTVESDWDTTSPALNGRFTVRLRVRHQDTGGIGPVDELYDAATVWLDNRNILVRITALTIPGGDDLKACDEVRLSTFVGTALEITGRAWDPLILNSVPDTEVPNDNFDYYSVTYKKDGAVTPSTDGITIPDPHVRVPNVLPTLPAAPNDVGVLATWDIVTALDAGVAPDPYVAPPYPKLYRGERCAYLIRLYARDKTLINDAGDIHDAEHSWPVCIMNDLA